MVRLHEPRQAPPWVYPSPTKTIDSTCDLYRLTLPWNLVEIADKKSKSAFG